MSTPLTDRINALTAYSNNKTGASDTTLSDAVTRLVAGYGGGGASYPFLQSYERIEITEDLSSMTVSQFQTRFLPDLTSAPYPTILILIENTIETDYAGQAAVRLSSLDGSYRSATSRHYLRGSGNIVSSGNNNFYIGQGSVLHKFTFYAS